MAQRTVNSLLAPRWTLLRSTMALIGTALRAGGKALAVTTDVTDLAQVPTMSQTIHDFYAQHAIPPDSFARVVAFAIE